MATPKKYTAYLANLGINVPVQKVIEEEHKMVIRTKDIPGKIAKRAGITGETVTYWYGSAGGGNKLIDAKGFEVVDYNSSEIVESIRTIAKAFDQISNGRLTRDAVVVLVHAKSKGVSKTDVETVLNALETLEQTWLKKV